MSAFPRCVALCLLAAAALLATVSAEVTIGQTYSGDVSCVLFLGTCSWAPSLCSWAQQQVACQAVESLVQMLSD